MKRIEISILMLVAAFFTAVDARPNIILVMADDLGWGDPSYNEGWIDTPALDAMAAEGLRFDRFYSASAVCSPTRASCLTGRNPLRVGIPNANTGRLGADETPLPELLDAAGYATGHFGKWHLGTLTTLRADSNRGAPGNTAVYSPPWQHGYDITFATEAKVPTFHPMRRTVNGLPEPLSFTDPNFYGTRYWTNPLNLDAPEGLAVAVTDNLSGDDSRVIMDRVIPFIQNAVANGDPFFSVVWFHTPHKPLPDPDGSLPVDSNGAYTKAITDMDSQIARLRTELQSLGVNEDTMLWFCSDNGPENGVGSSGPFRSRKRSLHEGGVRVPGILVWPEKIPTGRATSFPVVTSDFHPTILDYLDLTVPDQKPIDGISLRGVIENTDLIREEPIGFQYLNSHSWVDQQYKLISKDGGLNFELYDLLADPSEQRNLANSHEEVVIKMTREYQAWAEAVANDTPYHPPGDAVSVLLSTANQLIDGPFEVTVSFGDPVSGLEKEDFLISNGTIDDLAGEGVLYTLTVNPLVEGNVTLQLPADQVTNQDNDPNLASNTLTLFFTAGSDTVGGSIIIDDHFDTGDTSAWESQGNSLAAQHAITADNSVLESSVQANVGNTNRGLASQLSFDPRREDGFSLTFVVDEVGQAPAVNGFFLGIAADNTVFYRDGSTRNFGLTFFGIEERTNSSSGYGFNFGDNFGASGAEIRLDQGAIQVGSFLDGFTANLAVDRMGWQLKLFGVTQANGSDEPVLGRGLWSEAGTDYETLFGDDDSWHIVTSNQQSAAGRHTVHFERIRLVAGPEPAPRITHSRIDQESNQISFSFETVEGWRYFIDRSPRLGAWQQIGNLDASERVTTFDGPSLTGSRGFYRIRRP